MSAGSAASRAARIAIAGIGVVAVVLVAGVGMAVGRIADGVVIPQREIAPTMCPASLEHDFFAALNRDHDRRHETLAALESAVVAGERTPRIVLLLGLNHLWIAAEDEIEEVEGRRHLVLAIHHLRQAKTLLPDDHRIPSWLHAAEHGLAVAEGRSDAARLARKRLGHEAEREPCFHAVGFGIASFAEPRDSAEFRAAHAAMEASFECRGDNPSIVDMPRWPHNVHGFLVALADFRLKAGDARGAEMALVIAESRAGFAEWRHRALIDDRLGSLMERQSLYGNDDPADDPPFVFAPGSAVSCIGCHGR